jgi:hypothetical protein
MAVDPETVSLMGTYRVGYLPPKPESLAPGELYIEVAPSGGGAPRLWVGIPSAQDFSGNVGFLGQASTGEDVAPINIDVPLCYQEGDALCCTMGNWTGQPDTYAWQWQLDGVDAGDGTDTYLLALPDDIGRTAVCIVTASNAIGTTEGPPSNAVVVTEPVAVAAEAVEPADKPAEPVEPVEGR